MKFHIVSVGVGKHQEIVDLPTADKDASDFFYLFNNSIKNVGVKKLLLDSDATLANIKVALGKQTREQIGSEDNFIFYFSGHGAREEKEKEDTLEAFLVPNDGNVNDIRNSCISVTKFVELIEKIPAKQKIIFIDSCFSGSVKFTKGLFLKNKKSNPKVTKKIDFLGSLGKGNFVFTASTTEEEAFSTPELGNSLFTFYLLEELKKGKEPTISLTDILSSVVKNVEKYVKKNFPGDKQTPSSNLAINGIIEFPRFKDIKSSNFDMVDAPKIIGEQTLNSILPIIRYEDKEIEKALNETVEFFYSMEDKIEKYALYNFKQYCFDIVNTIIYGLNELFEKNKHKYETNLEDVIKEVQNKSLHLFIFSGFLAHFGTKKQIEFFSNSISNIYNRHKDSSGLVFMQSLHQVIYGELLYLVGIFTIENGNFEYFKKLLNLNVYKKRTRKNISLIDDYKVMYWDIYGNNPEKVLQYVLELFNKTFTWIKKIEPSISDDEKMLKKLIQVDFLLWLNETIKGGDWRPNFARYNKSYIEELLFKMSTDEIYKQGVLNLLSFSKEENIFEFIKKHIEPTSNRRFMFIRQSIDPEDLDKYIKGS